MYCDCDSINKQNMCYIFQVHRLKQASQKSVAVQLLNRAKQGTQNTNTVSARKRLKIAKLKIQRLRTELSEFLSAPQLEFVVSQMRCTQRARTGRRWTVKDKSLSLSLLHSSPKTYRLWKKIFTLPSIKTLKNVMKRIQIYPGFNDTILRALKQKTSSLGADDKLVVLAMDEMAIKEAITYDLGRDLVEGFVDGVERRQQVANHAIVFMALGIKQKWKQTIGYFL